MYVTYRETPEVDPLRRLCRLFWDSSNLDALLARPAMGTPQTVGRFWFAYECTRVGHAALFLRLDIGRTSGRLLVCCKTIQEPRSLDSRSSFRTSPARPLIRGRN